MYVLHAWKSSLQLFKPSNFKLFLLVTLKSLKNTYQRYLKYGWPFLCFITLSTVIAYKFQGIYSAILEAGHQGTYTAEQMFWLFGMCGYMILVMLAASFCTFLVSIFARPSVSQKNCAYIRSYTKNYFIWYLLQGLLYNFVYRFFYLLCIYWVVKANMNYAYWMYVSSYIKYIFYIVNIFSVLFLLDLGGGLKSFIKSIWFGIKMAFYNIPFVIAMATLLYVCARYITMLYILEPLLYPLWFCFMTSYYTKKVHDQARLYQGN